MLADMAKRITKIVEAGKTGRVHIGTSLWHAKAWTDGQLMEDEVAFDGIVRGKTSSEARRVAVDVCNDGFMKATGKNVHITRVELSALIEPCNSFGFLPESAAVTTFVFDKRKGWKCITP